MRQAVVLVGGKGTRLGKLTRDIPKPLLHITPERRFLDYLLLDLAAHGLTEILLIAGHLGDQVEALYHGARLGGAEVSVVREPSPAGTGGALHYVVDRLDPVFLMSNGDSFFDIDYGQLAVALKPGDVGTLALRRVDDARRYGTVHHKGGRVTRFAEKDVDQVGPAWISGGVYALTREILSLVDRLPLSIETDILPGLACNDQLSCIEFDGYFIDIGLPDTLQTARRELEHVAESSIKAGGRASI